MRMRIAGDQVDSGVIDRDTFKPVFREPIEYGRLAEVARDFGVPTAFDYFHFRIRSVPRPASGLLGAVLTNRFATAQPPVLGSV